MRTKKRIVLPQQKHKQSLRDATYANPIASIT